MYLCTLFTNYVSMYSILAQIMQKSKGFEEVIVKSELVEDENHSNIEEVELNPLELEQEIYLHSNPKVKNA